jgi:hypothetical protein
MTQPLRIIPVGEEPPPMVETEPAPTSNGRHRQPERASKPKGKHKAAGRFRTFNAFVDFTAKDLSRAELLVWLTLFRDCRDGLARTAQADLARRTGLCRKTIYNALRRLEALKLLHVARRGRLGLEPSSYRLRWLMAE